MRFFLSKFCPDFAASEAPAQKVARPLVAQTQCQKILAAFKRGEKITVLTAMQLCGGTSADRRLREVRKLLGQDGIQVHSEWIKTANGARIKQYYINQ